jgi:hypothetical protein
MDIDLRAFVIPRCLTFEGCQRRSKAANTLAALDLKERTISPPTATIRTKIGVAKNSVKRYRTDLFVITRNEAGSE